VCVSLSFLCAFCCVVCVCVYIVVFPICLCVCVVRLCVCVSVLYVFVYVCLCVSFGCVHICQCVCVSVCLLVCVFVCLCVCVCNSCDFVHFSLSFFRPGDRRHLSGVWASRAHATDSKSVHRSQRYDTFFSLPLLRQCIGVLMNSTTLPLYRTHSRSLSRTPGMRALFLLPFRSPL
jgi:hypothetical protein